jgi:hypothetical protein
MKTLTTLVLFGALDECNHEEKKMGNKPRLGGSRGDGSVNADFLTEVRVNGSTLSVEFLSCVLSFFSFCETLFVMQKKLPG